MTKSTGTSGLILLISPPTSFIALRNDAKSTTAGTPVKSCRITRDGLKGTSPSFPSLPKLPNALICSSVMTNSSSCLNTDSNKTRIE